MNRLCKICNCILSHREVEFCIIHEPEEPFTLSREPVKAKGPVSDFESNSGKQGVLFSGLDCLPGQKDLFETE